MRLQKTGTHSSPCFRRIFVLLQGHALGVIDKLLYRIGVCHGGVCARENEELAQSVFGAVVRPIVGEMVFDLMFSLNATEDQLDFPVVYGSAKNGWMGEDYNKPTTDITYLLDKIIEVIPAPKQIEGTPQMLITSLDYSSYTGRIAVGRVHRGQLKDGMQVTIAHRDGSMEKTKIKELHTFDGMGHSRIDQVDCGDICAVIGLEKIEIGDTICDLENPET